MKGFAIVFLLVVPTAIQCVIPPVTQSSLLKEISQDLTGSSVITGLGLTNQAQTLLNSLIGPNGSLASLVNGKIGSAIAEVLRFFYAPDGLLTILFGPSGIFKGQKDMAVEFLTGTIGSNGIVQKLFGHGGVTGRSVEERDLLGGLLTVILGLLDNLLSGLGLGNVLGRSIEERDLLSGLLGGVLGLLGLGGSSGGGGLLSGVLGLVKTILALVLGLLGGLLGGGSGGFLGLSTGNIGSIISKLLSGVGTPTGGLHLGNLISMLKGIIGSKLNSTLSGGGLDPSSIPDILNGLEGNATSSL